MLFYRRARAVGGRVVVAHELAQREVPQGLAVLDVGHDLEHAKRRQQHLVRVRVSVRVRARVRARARVKS